MCACILCHVRLFATPWTVAHPAPLSMEFSRQEYFSELPFPSPRDIPDPGILHESLESPSLTGEFFTIVPLVKLIIVLLKRQLTLYKQIEKQKLLERISFKIIQLAKWEAKENRTNRKWVVGETRLLKELIIDEVGFFVYFCKFEIFHNECQGNLFYNKIKVQFSSVIQLCLTLWAHGFGTWHASLFITNSWSLLKLMSVELVMPSNHLIFCSPSPPAFTLSQHQGLF